MIDNSISDSISELLQDQLVIDEKGKWCLEVEHYSGHYSDWKPIQYLDDDDIESLEEHVWDDFTYEYGDDFEWDDFDELFQDAFYKLVDENIGR